MSRAARTIAQQRVDSAERRRADRADERRRIADQRARHYAAAVGAWLGAFDLIADEAEKYMPKRRRAKWREQVRIIQRRAEALIDRDEKERGL